MFSRGVGALLPFGRTAVRTPVEPAEIDGVAEAGLLGNLLALQAAPSRSASGSRTTLSSLMNLRETDRWYGARWR